MDKETKQKYFWNILITLDQTANTILGGSPDETMSSRFGKWLALPHNTWKWRVAYGICRTLHVIDKNHCIKSIEEDEGDRDIV